MDDEECKRISGIHIQEMAIDTQFMVRRYEHFTPSTNNGLESNNCVIKKEQTVKERVLLSRFSHQTFEIVGKWSLAYPRNLKAFINNRYSSLDYG